MGNEYPNQFFKFTNRLWDKHGTLLGLLVFPYIRYYDYSVLSIWLFGVFLHREATRIGRLSKLVVLASIIIAFLFNLGNHLEPWVFQRLIWFYFASWVIVLEMNKTKVNGYRFHYESRNSQ